MTRLLVFSHCFDLGSGLPIKSARTGNAVPKKARSRKDAGQSQSDLVPNRRFDQQSPVPVIMVNAQNRRSPSGRKIIHGGFERMPTIDGQSCRGRHCLQSIASSALAVVRKYFTGPYSARSFVIRHFI